MRFTSVASVLASLILASPAACQLPALPTDIPAVCDDLCGVLSSAILDCTLQPVSCSCNDAFAQTTANCYNCTIFALNTAANLQTLTNTFNSYQDACKQAGFAETPIPLGGGCTCDE